MEPGFISRKLVAVQIKCGEGKTQKDVSVCSAYFPSDSVAMSPPIEFRELKEYFFEKKLEFLVGSDTNAYHSKDLGKF